MPEESIFRDGLGNRPLGLCEQEECNRVRSRQCADCISRVNIEYALMVTWEDKDTEFIPASDIVHAMNMARTIYAGQLTRVVGREVQPWRYARPLRVELGAEVSES